MIASLRGLGAPDPGAAHAMAARLFGWWRMEPDRLPSRAVEWMHVIVAAPGLRLLVNLSLREEAGRARARALGLLYAGGAFQSAVEELELGDLDLRAGRFDAYFGDSALRISDAALRLRFAPRGSELQAELVLRPVAAPMMATRLRLPGGGVFNWASLPRLVVESGFVVVGDACHDLSGASAYQDHNWGSFLLGGDIAWEWMIGLPRADADPWSLLGVRVLDRARHRALVTGLALWRDGILWRDFRDHEVAITREGRAISRRLHRVPEGLGWLRGEAVSLPRVATWAGSLGEDRLSARVEVEDHAQVLVPGARGVASLAEASTRIRLDGRVRGLPVQAELLGVSEVLDGESEA